MLRAFGVETARLMRRAAHQEFAGRDGHHLQALRTFLEFAVCCFLIAGSLIAGAWPPRRTVNARAAARRSFHEAIKAGTGSRANRFAFNVWPREKPMIRKLASGKYRLYSRKKNPKTGKRRTSL